MLSLEFLHASDEGVYALHGECVVERCAEATYVAVTLDTHHALSCSELDEVLLKLFVLGLHYEAYVHDRTILLVRHCSYEHLGVVDSVIELLSLGDIHLLDLSYTTEALVIFESLECCVDGEHRRSVEHGALVYVSLVLEHCGDHTVYVAESAVLHDADSHTGGCEVLLSTGVDEIVLGYGSLCRR